MSLFYLKRVSKNKLTRMGISHYNMCHKTIWHEERIMMETLEEAAMVHGIDCGLLVEKINAAAKAMGK